MVTVPVWRVHIPLPVEGLLPVSEMLLLLAQTVGLVTEILAVVGKGSTLIVIVAILAGQVVPVLIVQRSTLVPVPTPVTPVVFSVGVVMLAVPV